MAASISWYNYYMDNRPLIETNPHLSNPKEYEESLIINVTSSTAVELGKVDSSIVQVLKNSGFPSLIKFGEQPFLLKLEDLPL